MSRDTNIAAQEHLAENENAGNIDAAVESFAPDAVDHDPAPGQPAGREGFKAFFTELKAAFPDAHIDPAHLVADDNNVAVAYTLTGTHKVESKVSRPPARRSRRAACRSGASRTGRSSSGGAPATNSESSSNSVPSRSLRADRPSSLQARVLTGMSTRSDRIRSVSSSPRTRS